MQLNEISTTKTFPQLIAYISKNIETRKGKWSIVFKPEGKEYVYKAWTVDDGWESYLKILDNTNPYHPIVEKVKEIPITVDSTIIKIKVAKIEKLYPCNILNIIRIPAIRKFDNREIELEVMTISQNIETLEKQYTIDDPIKQQYALLFSSLLQIKQLRNNSHTVGLDFNHDNFMKRKNGHLVITDPLSDITGRQSIVGLSYEYQKRTLESKQCN